MPVFAQCGSEMQSQHRCRHPAGACIGKSRFNFRKFATSSIVLYDGDDAMPPTCTHAHSLIVVS